MEEFPSLSFFLSSFHCAEIVRLWTELNSCEKGDIAQERISGRWPAGDFLSKNRAYSLKGIVVFTEK